MFTAETYQQDLTLKKSYTDSNTCPFLDLYFLVSHSKLYTIIVDFSFLIVNFPLLNDDVLFIFVECVLTNV